MTLIASAAPTFKAAFVTAAIAAVNDASVLITYGHPGLELADDMIGVMRCVSDQGFAGMSTNRSREETLTLEVLISCFRGGGPDMEQVASERAYALLGAIEYRMRVTDTTVGNTVRQCLLTGHSSDGATDADILAEGRCIEVLATFEAKARIGFYS